MQRMLRGMVVLLEVLMALPAMAGRRHRAHGHVGAGDVFLGLALAPLLGLGLSVHTHHGSCHHQDEQPPPPPVYVAPPPVYLAPPQVYVAPSPPPPPPMYIVPPVVMAAPVAQAPAVAVRAERTEPRRDIGALAAKWTPGTSATLLPDSGFSFSDAGRANSVGLEWRLSKWFALRSDAEFRQGGRSFDFIGGKLFLAQSGMLRPYASVSLTASDSELQPGRVAFGAMGAAGVDLFLGRHVFFEAEARYRVTPGDCCSSVPQVTGVIGGGLAFF